ncbi:hypothetical protein BDW68DRAFT_178686 [Aspergillus falconensis]
MDPQPSLRLIGNEISAQFSALSQTLDTSYLRQFLNETQRFDIWASNLGVFHNGHSSLDYRFRDSPPLWDYTFNLLSDLNEALSAFTLQAATAPHPQQSIVDGTDSLALSGDESEEDFSSYQDESLPAQYLTNISITINRLYALSFRVRNPKMRTGLSKALSYKEVDSETGVDLMEAYKERDSRRLAELFRTWRNGDDAEGQFMVERLARANMHRRKQFKYWEKRRNKYDYYHRAATGHRWLGELESTSLQRDSRPSEPSTATSPNTAGILDSESTVSTDTFVVTAGGTFDPLELPPPPQVDADSPEFECPYCFTLCAEETARPHAWRRHILRDLRPYICTFENCKDADQQYDTFTDWVSHESSSHGVQATALRTCPICAQAGSTTHHVANHLRHIACFAFPWGKDAPKTSPGTAVHSNSANMGSLEWDSGSEDSEFDDEWAEHSKTVHMDLTACGFGVTRIQLRPQDVVETVSASQLRTVYNLPPATVFRFADPNGYPIPLDYDSLYDNMVVHVDYVADATSSATSVITDEPQEHRARDDPVPSQPAQLPHSSVSRMLGPRYTVQFHEYFSPGKASTQRPRQPSSARYSVLERGPQFSGRFGEPIYSTMRRMVVVRRFGQYSWCFAVTTYGGRGVAKWGLDPSKHAVLYKYGTTPTVRANEPTMVKRPLPVVLATEEQPFDPMSRLNFGKIYTVEHNVMIMPIGRIAPEAMETFTRYALEELSL